MVLVSLALLAHAYRDWSPPVGYVQSATSGCRIAAEKEWAPVRLLSRVSRGTTLLAPAGANLVVVFRDSGMRYRLIGPGQARVSKVDLTALKGAKVQRLGKLDLRLTSDAQRDRRYGPSIGGIFPQAGIGQEEVPLSNAPLPLDPAEVPSATQISAKPIPPLVLPLTPTGPVRELPQRIVLNPAPRDGKVTVKTKPVMEDSEKTFLLEMRKGVIEIPPDLFGEEFLSYQVLTGKKVLAEGEVRVMTVAQVAELARSERLARAENDEASLTALALLYEELNMPMDEDRILRELFARQPEDRTLREAIEALRREKGVHKPPTSKR